MYNTMGLNYKVLQLEYIGLLNKLDCSLLIYRKNVISTSSIQLAAKHVNDAAIVLIN